MSMGAGTGTGASGGGRDDTSPVVRLVTCPAACHPPWRLAGTRVSGACAPGAHRIPILRRLSRWIPCWISAIPRNLVRIIVRSHARVPPRSFLHSLYGHSLYGKDIPIATGRASGPSKPTRETDADGTSAEHPPKALVPQWFSRRTPSAYATPGTRAIAVAKPTRSNRQIPALLALPLTGPTPIPIQCDAETGGQRRTSCPLYFAENTPYISWESASPRKSHSHLSERFNSRRKMGKSDAMHAPRSNASAVRSPHIAQIFSLQMARSAQFATQRARTGYRPDTDWADQDDYCSNWADPVIQRPKTSSK